MKKYVVTLLLALISVFVLNPITAEAATPNFEEIPITVVDDMRGYDTKVNLSCQYEWGKNPVKEANANIYGETAYGKFTLKEDSIVRVKMYVTGTTWITTGRFFKIYGNNTMAVPLMEQDLSTSYAGDQYIELKAGTYYTECGWKRGDPSIDYHTTKVMIGAIPVRKAIEVNQVVDTKKKKITLTATQKFADPCNVTAKWCKGKVSGMPYNATKVDVVDDTVVIKLDKKAKGWYTVEFVSDSTVLWGRDITKQAHVYVTGIKKAATKGKTYTKDNVKYKITKNDSKKATGTVTVMGMKSHKSSVTIPKTVKIYDYTYTVNKIEKKAFYKKNKLKKVTIKATGITSFGKDSFKGIYKKATIYVPKSKYKTYSSKLKKVGVKSPMKIKKK